MTHDHITQQILQPKQVKQAIPSQDMRLFRQHIMTQLTSLLESQTRTRHFACSISQLISRVHNEIVNDLESSICNVEVDSALFLKLSATLETCRCLENAFKKLVDERQRRWKENSECLKELIVEVNETTEYLASVLIEKDLFERQSNVLENIILSHEKISQWKDFIQEILMGFHAIFPFNFFFIAFAEDDELSMFLYYIGDYSEEIKQQVRQKMSKDLLRALHLSEDMPLTIEEFHIPRANNPVTLEDVELLTVNVPEHAPGLSGLLGVAFASSTPLKFQEQSIIRSLLSVMVMVVGSSKVLSRTLSELEYYSIHDPLTGLHNRRYFNDMLDYEIGRSTRHIHEFAVLLLDLDDFKDINDSYGHPVGDAVLIKIAETINNHLRKGDISVRMGGDEFAIILPETPPNGAKVAAENIRKSLQEIAFETPSGKGFHISTSIGMICFPRDAKTFEDLMGGGDIALYRAKNRGKNEVCEFDPSTLATQNLRINRILVEDLRQAINEDRIVPYFQPIFDCKTGEIFAYESVARKIENDGKVTSAGQFIEAIEKYGLSREFDRIIVNKTINAIKHHMSASGSSQRVFINLSPLEIQGRGILGYAEELCNTLNLPPSSIVFEILERDAISDMSHMSKFLSNLRKKGFAFALDDFGSGYNSFHYLRELHFEYVKIDGAFVRNIIDSKIDRALVSNLSKLCQDLDILTIGEYVESPEIMQVLVDIGVDYAQGFHLGIPMKTFFDYE